MDIKYVPFPDNELKWAEGSAPVCFTYSKFVFVFFFLFFFFLFFFFFFFLLLLLLLLLSVILWQSHCD